MPISNRHHARDVLVCFFLLLALVGFLFWHFRGERPQRVEDEIVAASVAPIELQSMPQGNGAVSSTGRLDAKNIDAAKAKKLIASALRAIVNAESYRMTMTSLSSNGLSASFTLIHVKSPTRGDLFRMDIVNYDATMKPVPGLSRTEITNERGNWHMSDGGGEDGIAFLLKDNQEPGDTVGFHKAFEADAEHIESADNHYDYTATIGRMDDRSIVNITEKTTSTGETVGVYRIDAVSGDLLSAFTPVANFQKNFELTPKLDESAFDIPESQLVVPVSDMRAAERYLNEHN
jgi:hypothetical protein